MGMKLSPDEIARLCATPGAKVGGMGIKNQSPVNHPSIKAGRKGRHRHTAGQMNRDEARYAVEVLEPRRLSGLSWGYRFEPRKFDLSDRGIAICTYTPDFLEFIPGGGIVAHEVKGWVEDDAAVKMKWFANKYPRIPLHLSRRRKGQWEIKQVGKRVSRKSA